MPDRQSHVEKGILPLIGGHEFLAGSAAHCGDDARISYAGRHDLFLHHVQAPSWRPSAAGRRRASVRTQARQRGMAKWFV